MASSMAAMTMPRSIAFSRATASAICNSSSRLALTAAIGLLLVLGCTPIVLRRGLEMFRVMGRTRPVLARLACLTFRLFAAPQGFGDEGVGQNQSCFDHVP